VAGQLAALGHRVAALATEVSPIASINGAAYGALPEGQSGVSGAVIVSDPDVSTDEYVRFAADVNPDLPVAVALDEARGTTQRWGRVRRTFIRGDEDHTVAPALQDRMIAEADEATPRNTFVVHTLASSPFSVRIDARSAGDVLAAG